MVRKRRLTLAERQYDALDGIEALALVAEAVPLSLPAWGRSA
jgi:hypothetical protein